jgi:hypothetical protein
LKQIYKIFFFVESTFNQRDYNRFGFEILKSHGYEVHVWDFSPLLVKKAYKQYKAPDPIKYKYHELIFNKSDFNKISNRLNNSTIVSLIGLRLETKFVFNYLKENEIPFGFCCLGELPTKPRSVLDNVISGFQNPNLIISKIKLLIQRKVINHIYPNFIIMGGEKGYKSNRYPKNSSTELIKSHALDYDLYLNEEDKKPERIVNDDYAVFLDEFVPFHPDYYHMNIKPDCSSENYYPDINSFFDKVESKFDVKVVIAAHPRSDYYKKGNPFNKRVCIRNETINLVKYSKFVLAHASTSLNFAILYNKPMVFIKSHKYSVRFKNIIQFFSSIFGKKPINIGRNGIDIDLNLIVNERMYKSYKQQYIKAVDTPEKSNWDIFADHINKRSENLVYTIDKKELTS